MDIADTLHRYLSRLAELYAWAQHGGTRPNLDDVRDGVEQDMQRVLFHGRTAVRAVRARADLEAGIVPDNADLSALTGYTAGYMRQLRRRGVITDSASARQWIAEHCPNIKI